jgi:hypothetical protein
MHFARVFEKNLLKHYIGKRIGYLYLCRAVGKLPKGEAERPSRW